MRRLDESGHTGACGLDIDVPWMAWNISPGLLGSAPTGTGVMPARICTPGAVTSGLRKSPTGPRDQKRRHDVARDLVATPPVHDAITFVLVVMKFEERRRIGWSMCTDGM